MRTESATLARLRIDKEESDAVLGEEEEAVDVSPGGHITKRLARSRPVSQELMDSTGSGSHVSHSVYHVEVFLKCGLVTTSDLRCHKAKAQVHHVQCCIPHYTLCYLIHIFITHGVPQATTYNAF